MICSRPSVRLASPLLATALLLVSLLPSGHAQPPAVAHDGPAAEHPAHVRFWKADLRTFPLLRVVIALGSSGPKSHLVTHDIGSGGPGYTFNSYTDLPSGRGTISVFDAPAPGPKGPGAQPLMTLPVDLAAGSFVTVLLDEPTRPGGPPGLEVTVDDANDGGAGRAQITVRTFVAGLKDMRVTLGDKLNAQFTGRHGYLQMRGLQPDVYPVRTAGTGLDDKPFEWNNETDLRQHPHQTLLIYPDPYGRIRPRFIVDGEKEPEPIVDQGEQR